MPTPLYRALLELVVHDRASCDREGRYYPIELDKAIAALAAEALASDGELTIAEEYATTAHVPWTPRGATDDEKGRA